MIEAFWKEFGGALAGQWAARTLIPAFAFWGGALLAYAYRYGWGRLADWWAARSAPEQAAVLVGGLLWVAFTGLAVERFQDGALRLVEGYWPFPLRQFLARRWERRARRMEERWQELAEQCGGDPNCLPPKERAEYARLDGLRLRLPLDPGQMMPTLVGNILRGAEEHPQVRYGLAAGVCWPRLWLLLPSEVRKEIGDARGRLDEATRLFIWGLLFLIWTVRAWWAAVVGLAVAWLAYRWMVLAALVYGDLVRSAFDLYRFALYDALHLPRPSSPAAEREAGEKITRLLWRGP